MKPKGNSAYFFYLLRCVDSSLYCGITKNLKRRVDEHNSCSSWVSKYTRGRRPVKLVYFEKLPSQGAALRREAEVKKWTKGKKEALVKLNPGDQKRGRPSFLKIIFWLIVFSA